MAKSACIPNKDVNCCSDATGIQVHKSARVFAAFRGWADDNAVYNRMLDWKMRWDESDGVLVAARLRDDRRADSRA